MVRLFISVVALLLLANGFFSTECTTSLNQLVLKSDSIENNSVIDENFTPQGDDTSPGFEWEQIPEKTKSFALVVRDPDAPRGTWFHWIIVNIPKSTTKIEEGQIVGEQIRNSWGITNYKGPSPPKGQNHRYYFVLYALDSERLSSTDMHSVLDEIERHKIAESTIMAHYSKESKKKKKRRVR